MIGFFDAQLFSQFSIHMHDENYYKTNIMISVRYLRLMFFLCVVTLSPLSDAGVAGLDDRAQ